MYLCVRYWLQDQEVWALALQIGPRNVLACNHLVFGATCSIIKTNKIKHKKFSTTFRTDFCEDEVFYAWAVRSSVCPYR